MTRCTLTPTWQLPVLPNAPQYWRATPGEASPSLGKPTLSTTYAFGPTAASAHRARLARTTVWSHVEDDTNCRNR
ncbi:MAG TPA: hypothetical protein VGR06_14545 [Actinophytocola sp.]|nr:hypothetical protein [Actinophytocola sp.]